MSKIITKGPTLEQMQQSLFLDGDCVGNERLVSFSSNDEPETFATIESVKRFENNEWEIECFVPFTGKWHFSARYSTKTCSGEILRVWQEKA